MQGAMGFGLGLPFGGAQPGGLSAIGDALESLGYTGSYWYPGGDTSASLAGGLAWGSMWQDSTGATPVTALEQPVGFRADRRYLAQPSYGANAVSTATYTGSSAAAGSAHRIYSPAGAASAVEFASTLTVGQFYLVTFTIDSITTAGGGLLIGTAGATVLASGTGTFTRGFVATSTTASIGRASGVTDIQISGVSFQAITLPATVYGSDVVVNGEFATDTVWTKGAGWTISGGAAMYDGTGGTSPITQNIGLVAGKTYEVTFDVISNTGTGQNTVYFGSTGIVSNAHLGAGSYTFIGQASAGSLLYIYGRAGELFVIDSVVVRELKGTHLLQATSTARGTISARYNLLTYSQQFDNAAWLASGTGSKTSTTLTDSGGADYYSVYEFFAISASTAQYTGSVEFLKTSVATTFPALHFQATGGTTVNAAVAINTNTGVATARTGQSPDSVSVTSVGAYWRVKISATVNTGNTVAALLIYPAVNADAGATWVSSTIGSVTVQKVDLRLSAYSTLTIPYYQRIGSGTAGVWDYDTTGPMADGSTGVFPCYLRRVTDDQSASTKVADLTGTDEVFVGYGGVKESDAAAGTALSLGTDVTSVNGTYAIRFPVSNGTTDFAFAARGTTTITATATGHTAPKVAAVAGYADISTPTTSITVNGVTTTETGSLGTGNFASATVYDASQAGTARWVNDRCYYQLAVDGRATTAASRAALTAQLARDLMKLSY